MSLLMKLKLFTCVLSIRRRVLSKLSLLNLLSLLSLSYNNHLILILLLVLLILLLAHLVLISLNPILTGHLSGIITITVGLEFPIYRG